MPWPRVAPGHHAAELRRDPSSDACEPTEVHERGPAVLQPEGDTDGDILDGMEEAVTELPADCLKPAIKDNSMHSTLTKSEQLRKSYSHLMSRSVSRFSRWSETSMTRRRDRRVHFGDVRSPAARTSVRQVIGGLWHAIHSRLLPWLDVVETHWIRYVRPVVIVSSIFELWSMGIWLGFLTEPAMADTLIYVVAIDIACNFLYIVDTAFLLAQLYLDEWRQRQAMLQLAGRSSHGHGHGSAGASASAGMGRTTSEASLRASMLEQGHGRGGRLPRGGGLLPACAAWLATEKGRRQVKALCGLGLASATMPMQLLLLDLLRARRYDTWRVFLVLAFRLGRVIWSFRDCANLISQQEMEVYVDIRRHGTSGSPWNKARILAKQFLIVVFFGHLFGCLSYFVRRTTAQMQHGLRSNPDETRDYFVKFEEEGGLGYAAGHSFWHSYLLTLYKGFNLNHEDLLPERPIDLMLEVLASVMILLMKSYCIGSFFKYHQKREFELQRFSKLMHSVTQYLDLYEVPPSLRKAVSNHFRFQQANLRKIKTLEVIGQLPQEIQKKMKEVEVLPTVVDRNPTIFGADITQEYCISVATALTSQFLQPGEVIFFESEVPRELIFLDSGAVSFSRGVTVDGRKTEQLMQYIRADRKEDPTALGIVALILGCPHFFSARVRVGTEAVVLACPRAAFDELNATFPDQYEVLVRNAAETHLLDTTGKDLTGVERTLDNENETFLALQQHVRKTLQTRQASMNTTLTFAASSGNVKLVKELLQKRIEANVADYDKRSAVHVAASEGMSDVLEALLQAQGNPNTKDRWGSTPMQDALKNGFVGVANLLQRHHGLLAVADPAGELCTAASMGNTKRMQELLDFGVDTNAGDYDNRTAIHLSSSEGHLPVVTFLTSVKADVNVQDRWGSTPMQDAIRHGFTTVTHHLYASGGRVGSDFAANMLCDAAASGNLPLLRMLFEIGVEFNQGDYDGRTPAHLAAAEGQVLALNYLLNTARAAHSPVDRWLATPLQDALSGGHDLCVRILISVGGVLGPSAESASKSTVKGLIAEFGFPQVSLLRQHLDSHMVLVERGQARSDIFDTELAAKFNKELVNATIMNMRPLCDGAHWLADLLGELEAAAEPVWQLYRLLRDGFAVASEARFWAELKAIETKKGLRCSKDAQDMIFHKAFLSSMRFAPVLLATLERTVARVMGRVTEIQQQRLVQPAATRGAHPQGRARMSLLVAQEVMTQLGWVNRDRDGYDHLRQAGGASDSELTVPYLAAKVEAVARTLLPGEHLCMTLFRGALMMPESGVPTALHAPETDPEQDNAGLLALSKWLDAHSHARLAGRVEAAGDVPTMPAGAPLSAIYGSLWAQPRRSAHRRSARMDADIEPAQATAQLVAAELALLTLTAIILDAWDRDSNNAQRRVQGDRHSLHAKLYPHKQRLPHDFLTQKDVQELGRVFRETALACRGKPVPSAEERRRLRHHVKKRTKERAKGQGEAEGAEQATPAAAAATGAAAPAGAAPEGCEREDPEDLPIRVAKILALKDKLSLDELTILVDIDDNYVGHPALAEKALCGELSRERFVLNLLRCILNHDDNQKDVVRAAQTPDDVQCDLSPDLFDADYAPRSSREDSETESELYAVASKMQEQLSQGNGESGEDPGLDESRVFTSLSLDAHVTTDLRKASSKVLIARKRSSRLADIDERHGSDMHGSNGSGARLARQSAGWILLGVLWRMVHVFTREGHNGRRQRRIAKRFRELDDDGEGVGPAEMSQLMAVAFNNALGQDQELRCAYRVFELLNKADVGDLVTLPELLQVLPKLEVELREQQRKDRRGASVKAGETGTWAITRLASRLVVPPDAHVLHLWDSIKRWVVLYYMLEVPVRFAFLAKDDVVGAAATLFLVLNWCADIFMAMNIVLSFFRGFVHPTRGAITVFDEIRMHYLLSLFFVDVLACLPADLWVPTLHGSNGWLARPKAAIRLLRLLHMRHLLPGDRGLGDSVGFFWTAWNMIIGILILVHFLACMWWLLGTRYDTFDDKHIFNGTSHARSVGGGDRGSWTYTYVHRPYEPPLGDATGRTPFWWQYLISFYWSVGRITGQNSPGNIYAASWVEMAWICTLFLLNVAVNGYCDGILVDKVIAGDEQAIEAKAMVKIVDEYLHSSGLPPDLIKDVQASAEESGKVVERQRMEETIASLPHTLKQRVARRIFVPRLLASSQIFRSCSPSFLVELGAHCRVVLVSRETLLAHAGEPARQLMILNSGRVGVFGDNLSKLAETTTSGEVIGEMPFIFDLKHVAVIMALEDCKLSVLHRSDFAAACRLYPEDAMSMRRSAMKVIQGLSGDVEHEDGSQSPGRMGRSRTGSGLGGARSAMSFATTNSRPGGKRVRPSVSLVLRWLYAGDLKQVAEKIREEQQAIRQDVICGFVKDAADGDLPRLEATLARGEVLVDEGDYDHRTALHLAACNGHVTVVQALLEEHNASLAVKDRFGHTPMDDAVREKQLPVVRYLVSRGGEYQVDANVAVSLCQAAYDNDLDTLRLLLEEVEVNPNLSDYDDRTALHLAASEGHAEAVHLLLALPMINPSPKDRLGNTPLDDAMRHKHAVARDMLIREGAVMGDRSTGVLLCEAGFRNDVAKLKELRDSKVQLSNADYDWRTSLHLAASEGHLAAATFLLLEAKVDPSPLDRFRNTPLDDAMRNRHMPMEAFLRHQGGLSGRDPEMAQAVRSFKEVQQQAQVRKHRDKVEREVNKMELCSIKLKLQRFREHPTLHDDVAAFRLHATNFRSLLLRLLHRSVQPEPVDQMSAVDDEFSTSSNGGGQLGEWNLTKEYRERLLEQAGAGLDVAASRLKATLEGELLPWLAALSRAETQLLHVFMPGIKQTIARILEQLEDASRSTRFARKLWQEQQPKPGSFQCWPVGLLMQRVDEAPVDVVHRARLEAAALLWASSGPVAGAPGSAMKLAGETSEDDGHGDGRRGRCRSSSGESDARASSQPASEGGSPSPRLREKGLTTAAPPPAPELTSRVLRTVLEDEFTNANTHSHSLRSWRQHRLL